MIALVRECDKRDQASFFEGTAGLRSGFGRRKLFILFINPPLAAGFDSSVARVSAIASVVTRLSKLGTDLGLLTDRGRDISSFAAS